MNLSIDELNRYLLNAIQSYNPMGMKTAIEHGAFWNLGLDFAVTNDNYLDSLLYLLRQLPLVNNSIPSLRRLLSIAEANRGTTNTQYKLRKKIVTLENRELNERTMLGFPIPVQPRKMPPPGRSSKNIFHY